MKEKTITRGMAGRRRRPNDATVMDKINDGPEL